MAPKAKGGKAKAASNLVNNNDDDDDHCAHCKKNEDQSELNDNWVTCFICNKWYHLKCITSSKQI